LQPLADSDFQMLQWTTKEAATSAFGLIVHQPDAEREYAYDRNRPSAAGQGS